MLLLFISGLFKSLNTTEEQSRVTYYSNSYYFLEDNIMASFQLPRHTKSAHSQASEQRGKIPPKVCRILRLKS